MIPDENTQKAVKNFCLLSCGQKRAGTCDIPVTERHTRCLRIARNIWDLGLTETQKILEERVKNGEVPA